MEGYGEAGGTGAQNGDLYIEMFVLPHKHFERTGDNLETTVEISPSLAVLGTTVEIETIDKRHIDLKIPATSSTYCIPDRRRGREKTRKTRRSSCPVKIVTPKGISGEQKELYEKLAELEGHGSKNVGSSPGSWERRKERNNFLIGLPVSSSFYHPFTQVFVGRHPCIRKMKLLFALSGENPTLPYVQDPMRCGTVLDTRPQVAVAECPVPAAAPAPRNDTCRACVPSVNVPRIFPSFRHLLSDLSLSTDSAVCRGQNWFMTAARRKIPVRSGNSSG